MGGRKVRADMTQSIGYQPEIETRRGAMESPLTKREWEILWMISKGHDNKGIAELLGIRTQTVKNHTSNLLSKMQARNRTHAAMMAISKGWLDFPVDGAGPESIDSDPVGILTDDRGMPRRSDVAAGGYESRIGRAV